MSRETSVRAASTSQNDRLRNPTAAHGARFGFRTIRAAGQPQRLPATIPAAIQSEPLPEAIGTRAKSARAASRATRCQSDRH